MSGELFAVTGANGFVGRATITLLRRRGFAVRALTRSVCHEDGGLAVGEIGAATDWSRALDGVTHLIHTAGRAHVMKDEAADPLAVYREVNVQGTRRLAEQAVVAGVKRLVLISSVKVNGERTRPGEPFTACDQLRPEDAYGRSKWEAEQAMMAAARGTRLETVVVRPPLVYGPGVKGNLARLLRWVRAGVPLPLGAVHNKRSLIALDNLIDLLACCATHPRAAGQTFLASDGEDLSTPELIRLMARTMGLRAHLVPVPVACLDLAARLMGRGGEIERLVGSLQVDIQHTCSTLSWRPPVAAEDGWANVVEERCHPPERSTP